MVSLYIIIIYSLSKLKRQALEFDGIVVMLLYSPETWATQHMCPILD